MTEPYDVFLSYSMADREWAAAFAQSLEESGVRVWFDVSSIAPGERWQDRIQDALRASKVLVVVLSSASIESPWTFFELGAAVADKKRIIPVIANDVQIERIPSLLRQFQFLRESSPLAAGKRIAEVISTNGG
jgi:TIR domain